MFVQYLSPLLIFIALSQLSIFFPRVGSIAHASLGLLLPVLLKQFNFTFAVFITLPLLLLAVLYWFGRPQPRRAASATVIGLSIIALVICGLVPGVRVSGRINDNYLGVRLVNGNGIQLVWASEGPGWPRVGLNWNEAIRRCQYLDEDGQVIRDTPQNIWRLPTVEEAVRSMSRHGFNSGGLWDAQNINASYQIAPDKESPLWNIHSQIIYWWTATEIDDEDAYMIAYDGKVWPRRKRIHPAYLGFRCVKLP